MQNRFVALETSTSGSEVTTLIGPMLFTNNLSFFRTAALLMLVSIVCAFHYQAVDEKIVFERKVTYPVHPQFKSQSQDILDGLEAGGILQRYLHRFKPPGRLYVEFYDGEFVVKQGNYISQLDVVEMPSVSFESFFPLSWSFLNGYYTLAVTDMTKTSQSARAVWVNMRVDKENVKTGSLKNRDTMNDSTMNAEFFTVGFDPQDDADTLVPYVPPYITEPDGVHQIVFILFRQPRKMQPLQRLKFRDNWGSTIQGHGVQDWADYYDLQPIGLNYYTTSDEGLFYDT